MRQRFVAKIYFERGVGWVGRYDPRFTLDWKPTREEASKLTKTEADEVLALDAKRFHLVVRIELQEWDG